MSKNSFRKMTISGQIILPNTGELIASYLAHGVQQGARVERNDVMHRAITVDFTHSGPLQTIVRDLWALLLLAPFDLTAGYTMRR